MSRVTRPLETHLTGARARAGGQPPPNLPSLERLPLATSMFIAAGHHKTKSLALLATGVRNATSRVQSATHLALSADKRTFCHKQNEWKKSHTMEKIHQHSAFSPASIALSTKNPSFPPLLGALLGAKGAPHGPLLCYSAFPLIGVFEDGSQLHTPLIRQVSQTVSDLCHFFIAPSNCKSKLTKKLR